MTSRSSIWCLVVTLVFVTATPTSLRAETFLRGEDVLRASAYQLPVGMQLAAASSLGDAMQSGETGAMKTRDDFGQKWRAARQTGEVLLFNGLMTLFGYYLMDEHGFNVTLNTIEENLKNGFEWDDNTFSANNFRHPYQGAQYFGAARANHYDFYQASVWAFFGSWLFEYAGEAHHPSYNDWLNTAIGGIGLGEPLYRLQNMVLNNEARGSSRVWRELGGFLVLPLAGLNRMFTGEAFEVHQNPPDDTPDHFGGEFLIGTRTLSDEHLFSEGATRAFIDFKVGYGDPFEPVERPYDAFSFRFQGTFNNKPHGLSVLQSRGVLASGTVFQSEASHHVLSADQLFDYVDNEAYTYGGQTVAASYFSRFWKNDRFEARTKVTMGAIVIGASKSDYFNISGREYDYGPGAAYAAGVEFAKKGRKVLTVTHAGFWIFAVNGTRADHFNRLTEVRLDLPIRDFLGVGGDYVLYESERSYKDYPDVRARNPELKLYLAWFID